MAFPGTVHRCPHHGAELQSFSIDPRIGARMGDYWVHEGIGRGARGHVYRASDPKGGTHAIKILIGRAIPDPDADAQLVAKTRLLRDLRHANIVQVRDVGSIPDGATYIVMELLRGESLASISARTGALHPYRIAEIGRGVALGLAHTHKNGWVHRDIKPSNLMIAASDAGYTAKILDYGSARHSSLPGHPAKGSGHGFLGTPLYMAPEQAQDPQSATPRSDLYGLGIMLFELLEGQPPFTAATIYELIAQHQSQPVPPMDGPPRLRSLILQLLQKSPDQRPETAAQVAAELAGAMNDMRASMIADSQLPGLSSGGAGRAQVGADTLDT